jgi:hypothetical protein
MQNKNQPVPRSPRGPQWSLIRVAAAFCGDYFRMEDDSSVLKLVVRKYGARPATRITSEITECTSTLLKIVKVLDVCCILIPHSRRELWPAVESELVNF